MSLLVGVLEEMRGQGKASDSYAVPKWHQWAKGSICVSLCSWASPGTFMCWVSLCAMVTSSTGVVWLTPGGRSHDFSFHMWTLSHELQHSPGPTNLQVLFMWTPVLPKYVQILNLFRSVGNLNWECPLRANRGTWACTSFLLDKNKDRFLSSACLG